MTEGINKRELAVKFHKALGRDCRAGSTEYGYLTSWGGMPEYDIDFEFCLYGANELAEELNIEWSLSKKDSLFNFNFGDKSIVTDDIQAAIMVPVIEYMEK